MFRYTKKGETTVLCDEMIISVTGPSGFNAKTVSYMMYILSQLGLWSWRVRSFLWWRETVWLWAADEESQRQLTISQLISIKMAYSSGPAPQETWPSTQFPGLLKDSTSVTSVDLENHRRAGWLSEVRRVLVALQQQLPLQSVSKRTTYHQLTLYTLLYSFQVASSVETWNLKWL